MDYRSYHCNKKERIQCLFISIGIGSVIAYLFYRSIYAMILVLPLFFLVCTRFSEEKRKKRKKQLLYGFREAMQAVATALLAGYSMENAWREAEKELNELYEKQTDILTEFQQMNAKVRMNQPLEQVLAEFAEKSGCEDIESFSEVFSFAKRSGGDFPGIIRTTVQRLNAKMEVEREIDTVIAGKKMEGRIMNGMPIFLLLYLNFTSGDFLEPLYGNLFGVCVMTGVLAVYLAAMHWSKKIADIQI